VSTCPALPLLPLQCRTAHEAAQAARQLGRARKGMEDALARAAATGGAMTLRHSNKRSAASQLVGEGAAASVVLCLRIRDCFCPSRSSPTGDPPPPAGRNADIDGCAHTLAVGRTLLVCYTDNMLRHN
jgi:hypothetical protein